MASRLFARQQSLDPAPQRQPVRYVPLIDPEGGCSCGACALRLVQLCCDARKRIRRQRNARLESGELSDTGFPRLAHPRLHRDVLSVHDLISGASASGTARYVQCVNPIPGVQVVPPRLDHRWQMRMPCDHEVQRVVPPKRLERPRLDFGRPVLHPALQDAAVPVGASTSCTATGGQPTPGVASGLASRRASFGILCERRAGPSVSAPSPRFLGIRANSLR
jgi:hypothetical protein